MNSKQKSHKSYDECIKCGGFCCKFQFQTVPLRKLKESNIRRWMDYLRYKCHDEWDAEVRGETVKVFVIDHRCRHLGDDNLCKAYEDRPEVCYGFPQNRGYIEQTWAHKCELMRNECKKSTSGGFRILKGE